MWLRISVLFATISLLTLTACQQQQTALPTLVNLDALATDSAAATQTSQPPTRTSLPPTWTPSPPPSETPADTIDLFTPTPLGFRPFGTLYYIFNDDSIVELAADGSFEDLLPIPHIGQLITDLRLSPNGEWLAYVAPGSGSARELYVTDRTGTNTVQVSRLGFARVFSPAWKPDSSALVFLASQAPETPLEVYIVGVDGSGQRQLTQGQSANLREPVWNAAGDRVFFSDDAIYAVDLMTGARSPALTIPSGFGADYELTHSPVTNRLYYLKRRRNMDTGEDGSVLSFIDTTSVEERANENIGPLVFYDALRFSPSGDYLLLVQDGDVLAQTQVFNTSVPVVRGAQVDPRPVFSPDSELVAYVNVDDTGIEQIYIVSRQGGTPTQITTHTEGTMTDLHWAEG